MTHAHARPLISVVVPAYNAEQTLAFTIASLGRERDTKFECIIVNDGSTDSTGVVADDLARRDARVRVVHQANRGLAGARNTGIEHARGDLLYFLDADDWVLPGGLGALARACEQTGASFGAFEFRDSSGARRILLHEPTLPAFSLPQLLDLHFVIVHSTMYHRDALAHHRFSESVGRVEDYELWYRLAAAGVTWTNARARVCAYRCRPSSMSRNDADMARSAARVISGGFALARTLPESRRAGLDLSPHRETGRLESSAFSWATRAAITSSVDAGMAIYSELGRTRLVLPDRAAGAALSAVVSGLGQRPDPDAPAAAAWLASAREWWSALSEAGIASPSLADEAAALLLARAREACSALGEVESRHPAQPLDVR